MGEPLVRGRAVSARYRGGSLKRLDRPYRFTVQLHEHQGERVGLNVMEALDPVYLNAGLMKPRKGLTLVAGKEKLGMGQRLTCLDKCPPYI